MLYTSRSVPTGTSTSTNERKEAMSRKIKALGLALFAAFAFSAIVAQAASAAVEEHEFVTTGEETTVLTGHQESGENHHTFRVGSVERTLTCHVATFSGTVVGKEVDHVEVVPKYEECRSDLSSTGAATVHTSGCTYTFDSDTEETVINEVAETHATVSLTCPESKYITIIDSGCEIRVPPFKELHGVTYENYQDNELDAVTVKATVREIPAFSTGGLPCFVAGLTNIVGKEHKSVYTGGTEVTGYKDESTTAEGEEHKYTEGAQTNITVKGTP